MFFLLAVLKFWIANYLMTLPIMMCLSHSKVNVPVDIETFMLEKINITGVLTL